jgi:hypothetical protein
MLISSSAIAARIAGSTFHTINWQGSFINTTMFNGFGVDLTMMLTIVNFDFRDEIPLRRAGVQHEYYG